MTGELTVELAEGDLVDLAVAFDSAGAAAMAEVRYRLGDTTVEVTPATPLAEINDALAQSDTTVIFRHGTYTGDLVLAGSGTTLFCDGPLAPSFATQVELLGTVTVGGSNNRVRGALLRRGVAITGSDAGMAFSFANDPATVGGSDADLLANVLCSGLIVTGSGARALGNFLGCG